jgi:hypothetical protein
MNLFVPVSDANELNGRHLNRFAPPQPHWRASCTPLDAALWALEETMAQFARNRFRNEVRTRFVLALLAVTTILTGWASGQTDSKPSQVGEGCLLYRSPVSGQYEPVPLLHTDAAIDIRGLVAVASVTQQYANSGSEPIEAVYVFPLPHDAAVYDMEMRIGNRVIRSVIHEREEAKRVYEAAKSEGKRAALVEEEVSPQRRNPERFVSTITSRGLASAPQEIDYISPVQIPSFSC